MSRVKWLLESHVPHTPLLHFPVLWTPRFRLCCKLLLVSVQMWWISMPSGVGVVHITNLLSNRTEWKEDQLDGREGTRTLTSLPILEPGITFSLPAIGPETCHLTFHCSTTSATMKATFAFKWTSKSKQVWWWKWRRKRALKGPTPHLRVEDRHSYYYTQ